MVEGMKWGLSVKPSSIPNAGNVPHAYRVVIRRECFSRDTFVLAPSWSLSPFLLTCRPFSPALSIYEPIEIIPGLYLGSCFASYNIEAMRSLNVKYIINCSGQDNVYRNVEPGVVSYGIGVCVFACTCEGSRRFQHFA